MTAGAAHGKEAGARAAASGADGRPPLPEAALDDRVIAIVRGLDVERTVAVGQALDRAGIRCVEVTLNSPAALESIAALADALPEGTVGAGTVLDVAAGERALDAGARFLVSPHVDVELIGWAAARGVPALPGAMTPTEAVAAWRAGAAAVKLFPAGSLGPGYLRALRGPLDDIAFVPTGGVDASNAAEWMAAGAVAVAVGGALTAAGDPAESERAARSLRAAVASAPR